MIFYFPVLHQPVYYYVYFCLIYGLTLYYSLKSYLAVSCLYTIFPHSLLNQINSQLFDTTQTPGTITYRDISI